MVQQMLHVIKCCKFSKVSSLLLTLSWRRSLSSRNQSIGLQRKSIGFFLLYGRDFHHERVNNLCQLITVSQCKVINESYMLPITWPFLKIFWFVFPTLGLNTEIYKEKDITKVPNS